MKKVVTFSGGKDSQAVIAYCLKNNYDFDVVFCDTGWESPITLQHVDYVEQFIGKKITWLRSGFTFESLAIHKKRVPSTKARFCTTVLKIEPMIDHILNMNESIVVYQGMRAEESPSRQKLNAADNYFIGYEEDWVNYTYRKSEVLEWMEQHSATAIRPILNMTAKQVFNLIASVGMVPNPLYKLGFSRVGCMPCINARHNEIKQMIRHFPERIDRIRDLEKEIGRTYFPPGYIPEYACSGKDEDGNRFPTVDDVVNYLSKKDQLKLFDPPKCQSVYNLCE